MVKQQAVPTSTSTKVHLQRYKQLQYLQHLRQYIDQQASTTIHLVDLHQKQPTSWTFRIKMNFKNFLVRTSLTSQWTVRGILQVATNIDKKEQQLQEDLIKQTIELQDFYEDDLSQYTEENIKAAIASELHSLGKKNIYGEVDIDSLEPKQQRRVVNTRWVIGPRSSSTSVDDIDITTGPLKARFVAKGYSQYISDHIKETFAATPSSTSLRTLLLHAVLHQYQVTSCDISSAFLNTPIEEDIYVQPPPEVYQHRPRVVWKLHRALYGLRTSPKMWQEHLHSTLRGLQLQQLKSDRCVLVKPNLMALADVDDLLIAGTSREASLFLEQLQQSFSLKHSTVLTTQQPLPFLGKRICRHPNGDITISLEGPTATAC